MVEIQMKHHGALGMLWVDLETTGSNEHHDEIIEVGAIYTDFEFNDIDTFTCVIQPSDAALGRLMKNEVVRNMHTSNGLLDECISSNRTMLTAQTDLWNWLSAAKGSGKGPLDKFRFMLAGSGVGHFDRRFINKYMPQIDRLLVFAPFDVGQVRRMLKFAGVDLSSADNTEAKNHRALDDITLHLHEARTYRDMFKQLDKMQGFEVNA